MKMTIASALAVATLATGAFADTSAPTGDVEAGEKAFKKCKSCHMIQDADGENIVKGGKTGPNLYGVVGRTAGTYEGFKYGKDLVAAGEGGLVWTEEEFVAYVSDPKAYMKARDGKSKMTFRLKSGAEDVYAYLASVGPAMEEEAAEEAKSE